MSDRIIIVRVLGLGSLLTDAQLVLTSRGTLPYFDPAATLQGVVADLGDQYSSEIGFFDSMGSDPTTAFSVISTAETRAALLGRAKVPVYDANLAPVMTTTYVPPLFDGVTIGVSDTSSMFVGQRIRIGTIAWEVTDVPSPNAIVAKRIWGSPRTPIPMILAGDEPAGMVVYDLFLSTGNVEGLPIVISTAEVTATTRAEEEVIFRGQITKVAVDTSIHAANQIAVQCGSLMGYLRNAPFRPPVGQGAVLTMPSYLLDPDNFRSGSNILVPTKLTVTVNSGVYGVPTVDGSGGLTGTSMRAFQVRDGGRGTALGYSQNYEVHNPWVESVEGYEYSLAYMMPFGNVGDAAGTSFLWVFDTSFFTSKGQSAITESMANFEEDHVWVTGAVTAMVDGGWVCAGDVSPATMLSDLLFGSVDGDDSGHMGWRSATEAAWLPYSEDEAPGDVVDLASLEALLQGRDDVFPGPNPLFSLRPLPYDAGGAKTVGDVLGLILKRLGGFAIFDRGKLRFGSWAAGNPIPTVVTDAALAEPRISLDFDRSACLQAVEVELGVYRWRASQSSDTNRTIKRPVTNLDLGAAGLGKTTQMGCFVSKNEGPTWVDAWILGTSWFATANQAIVRYSQPAARVVVTYRDTVADLTVGETVAFSTAFLPSASGAMGVELAVGIVLKAARSWRTPTTEYTLLLFGYTQASAAKVPLVAVAARATGPAVGSEIPIEPVWFTRGALATGGAPTTDAEAWKQAATLMGTSTVQAILCDSHGTEIGGGVDFCEGLPATSVLNFPGGPPFGGATIAAGDVVILAWASAGWDAFQADGSGELDGSAATAFPWVS
jgi:hypothetical protein